MTTPMMLWTIGGVIVVSVVLNIVVGIVVRIGILARAGAGKTDQRDREISRFGEPIGQSILVIGEWSRSSYLSPTIWRSCCHPSSDLWRRSTLVT